jgi:predicted nucleic acid-binding protein
VAVYFFDSSALVKRYAQETGSEWILALTEPAAGHSLYIARITAVGVVSALTRRQRGSSVSAIDAATAMADFRHDLSHQYRVIEITPTVITRAMQLAETHGLRGYDAVQLAAALIVQKKRETLGLSALELVSADGDLNHAAATEDLTVDNPNSH